MELWRRGLGINCEGGDVGCLFVVIIYLDDHLSNRIQWDMKLVN